MNQKKSNYLYHLLGLMLMAQIWFGCGSGGTSSSSDDDDALVNMTGLISNQTGETAQLEGWKLVLVNNKDGESRLATIAASGAYTFKNVSLSNEYTLLLLDSEHRISSLLAIPSSTTNTKVHQYFKITQQGSLPKIIYKGPIIDFSSTDNLEILAYTADDLDGDGIPNGFESSDASELIGVPLEKELSFLLAEDTDSDGITNDLDADIDNDGLLNWFDDDDNNNQFLDIFDLDANGDKTLDTKQKQGDLFFNQDVEHILVQLFINSDNSVYLVFRLKLSESAAKPKSITITTASNLTDQALVLKRNSSGIEEPSEVWDLSLKDDGQSNDDAANDGIYAQKIQLKSGVQPKAKQTVFFTLNYSSDSSTYTRDYPFTFPNVTTDSITFTYTSSSRLITKSGTPFGSETGYFWSVAIYNSSGILTHQSPNIDGSTDTYTIPEGELSSSETYTAKIFAQSLDKIPSYPNIVIQSDSKELK